MKLSVGTWVYCEDIQKWYLYMGYGNLRLPKCRKQEMKYWKLNKK